MEFIDLVFALTANIIGVFIGFLLASLNQRRISRKTDKNDMKALSEAFAQELENNIDVLETILNRYNHEHSNRFEYENSVWHSIITSGSLFKLFSSKDNSFKKNLLNLYSLIDRANLLERSIEMCCYSSAGSNNLQRLKNKRLVFVVPISNEILYISDLLDKEITFSSNNRVAQLKDLVKRAKETHKKVFG
jgi:uncharacterized membrane-anchored protein YhcB (DUF1043 family)